MHGRQEFKSRSPIRWKMQKSKYWLRFAVEVVLQQTLPAFFRFHRFRFFAILNSRSNSTGVFMGGCKMSSTGGERDLKGTAVTLEVTPEGLLPAEVVEWWTPVSPSTTPLVGYSFDSCKVTAVVKGDTVVPEEPHNRCHHHCPSTRPDCIRNMSQASFGSIFFLQSITEGQSSFPPVAWFLAPTFTAVQCKKQQLHLLGSSTDAAL